MSFYRRLRANADDKKLRDCIDIEYYGTTIMKNNPITGLPELDYDSLYLYHYDEKGRKSTRIHHERNIKEASMNLSFTRTVKLLSSGNKPAWVIERDTASMGGRSQVYYSQNKSSNTIEGRMIIEFTIDKPSEINFDYAIATNGGALLSAYLKDANNNIVLVLDRFELDIDQTSKYKLKWFDKKIEIEKKGNYTLEFSYMPHYSGDITSLNTAYIGNLVIKQLPIYNYNYEILNPDFLPEDGEHRFVCNWFDEYNNDKIRYSQAFYIYIQIPTIVEFTGTADMGEIVGDISAKLLWNGTCIIEALNDKVSFIPNRQIISNYFFKQNGVDYSKDIEKIIILNPEKIWTTTLEGTFRDLTNLTEIVGINDIDVSLCTSMSYTFYNDIALLNIDISNWKSTTVTITDYMFFNCMLLEEIIFNKEFDFNNLISSSGMFRHNHSLKSIDLSDKDFSKLKDVSWMFNQCSTITDINLSNLTTTGSLESMLKFCSDCKLLKNINFTNSFNVSNVKDFSFMFENNYSLVTLDLTCFLTQLGTNFSYMFNNNYNLKELIFPGLLFTSELINTNQGGNIIVSYMFCNCKSLKYTLNLVNPSMWLSGAQSENCLFNVSNDKVGSKFTINYTEEAYANILYSTRASDSNVILVKDLTTQLVYENIIFDFWHNAGILKISPASLNGPTDVMYLRTALNEWVRLNRNEIPYVKIIHFYHISSVISNFNIIKIGSEFLYDTFAEFNSTKYIYFGRVQIAESELLGTFDNCTSLIYTDIFQRNLTLNSIASVFFGCSTLTNIFIPKNIFKPNTHLMMNLGFKNCSLLKKCVIKDLESGNNFLSVSLNNTFEGTSINEFKLNFNTETVNLLNIFSKLQTKDVVNLDIFIAGSISKINLLKFITIDTNINYNGKITFVTSNKCEYTNIPKYIGNINSNTALVLNLFVTSFSSSGNITMEKIYPKIYSLSTSSEFLGKHYILNQVGTEYISDSGYFKRDRLYTRINLNDSIVMDLYMDRTAVISGKGYIDSSSFINCTPSEIISIRIASKDIRILNGEYLFNNFNSLISIENIEYLDFSEVTSLKGAFANITGTRDNKHYNLGYMKIDLSKTNINWDRIITIESMFENSRSISEVVLFSPECGCAHSLGYKNIKLDKIFNGCEMLSGILDLTLLPTDNYLFNSIFQGEHAFLPKPSLKIIMTYKSSTEFTDRNSYNSSFISKDHTLIDINTLQTAMGSNYTKLMDFLTGNSLCKVNISIDDNSPLILTDTIKAVRQPDGKTLVVYGYGSYSNLDPFYSPFKITGVDITKIIFIKPTQGEYYNMVPKNLFAACSTLENIYGTKYINLTLDNDIDHTLNFGNMFSRSYAIKEFDINDYHIDNEVFTQTHNTTFVGMFYSCIELEKINLNSPALNSNNKNHSFTELISVDSSDLKEIHLPYFSYSLTDVTNYNKIIEEFNLISSSKHKRNIIFHNIAIDYNITRMDEIMQNIYVSIDDSNLYKSSYNDILLFGTQDDNIMRVTMKNNSTITETMLTTLIETSAHFRKFMTSKISLIIKPLEYINNFYNIAWRFDILNTTLTYTFGYFNTSKVINMTRLDYRNMLIGYFFHITNTDFHNFDTSNVVNMNRTFEYYNYDTINLSGWDFSKVKDMDYFILGDKLKELDLGHLRKNQIITAFRSFNSLSSLTSLNINIYKNRAKNMAISTENINLEFLDICNFSSNKLTSLNVMFHGNTKLRFINLENSIFNKATVDYLFNECNKLEYINIDILDISNTTSTTVSFLFTNCYNLANYIKGSTNPEGYLRIKTNSTTIFNTNCFTNLNRDGSKILNLIECGTSLNPTIVTALAGNSKVLYKLRAITNDFSNNDRLGNVTVKLYNDFSLEIVGTDNATIQNTSMLLQGVATQAQINSIEKIIIINPIRININGASANTTAGNGLFSFAGCKILIGLDNITLSQSDVGASLNYLFSKLGSHVYDLVRSENNPRGEKYVYPVKMNIKEMKNWDISFIESFVGMFQDSAILNIDLSNWKCKNVNIDYMFQRATITRTIDISGFESCSSVISTFERCTDLEYLYTHDNFINVETATPNTFSLESTFASTNKLRYINSTHWNFGPKLNLSLNHTFQNCFQLGLINLQCLYLNNAVSIIFNNTFENCYNLDSFVLSMGGSPNTSWNPIDDFEINPNTFTNTSILNNSKTLILNTDINSTPITAVTTKLNNALANTIDKGNIIVASVAELPSTITDINRNIVTLRFEHPIVPPAIYGAYEYYIVGSGTTNYPEILTFAEEQYPVEIFSYDIAIDFRLTMAHIYPKNINYLNVKNLTSLQHFTCFNNNSNYNWLKNAKIENLYNSFKSLNTNRLIPPTIINIEDLDLTNLTNLEDSFYVNSDLHTIFKLPINRFRTHKVKSFINAFMRSNFDLPLDISFMDFSSATNTASMFYNARNVYGTIIFPNQVLNSGNEFYHLINDNLNHILYIDYISGEDEPTESENMARNIVWLADSPFVRIGKARTE